MLSFEFPWHTVQDEYPKNSVITQFGNGYSFASAPVGPPQMTFHLFFDAMWWFFDSAGTLDRFFSPEDLPGVNIAVLDDFYATHQLYTSFRYYHPSRGMQTVRFAKPFVMPRGVKGNMSTYDQYSAHQVEPFQIDLISAL
jgi:hypothetical protein